MKHFWRDHGLSLVMFGLFALFLGGQALVGWHMYNEEQIEHAARSQSFLTYLTSSHFGEAVFENWESEFLQMASYVFFTVFLFHKGSAESKEPGKLQPADENPMKHHHKKGAPWPVRRGGWVLRIYRNSLGLTLALLFVLSFVMHGVTGAQAHCAESQQHSEPCESVITYMVSSQFWFESLQNWQSEFLAVGTLIVLSVYLRQQGSPESKPVAAPHEQTGE